MAAAHRRQFVVNVASIIRSGGDRRERRTGPVSAGVTGSWVAEGSDVTVDVVLQAAGDAVEAVGTVAAPWVGECRRCLRPVAGELVAPIEHELFEARPDELTYPLTHDEIDLEPLARDAVLLELPQAPLCREDCRGLCPECGADRNEGDCGCEPPLDPRWAELDSLLDRRSDADDTGAH